MNYVSGLMLGASLANMLRQTLGGGSGSASFAHGMSGGRGRFLQGDALTSNVSALSGLFGSGRMGGGASFLSLPAARGTGRMDSSDAAAVQARMQETAEPPFVCVHASCGRQRYRTPYLTAEFAKVLEARLARLPFVAEVRANALAGSILLVYAPEDEAHILILAEGLEAIFAEGRTAPPPATLARSLRRSVHEFSGWIQRNTGGALDLSSVVAGIFVLRGIRQLVLSNNTPSGSQMLWWALTLMRGWKV